MLIILVSACLGALVPVRAQDADLPMTAPIPESRDENQPLPDVGKAVPVPQSRDENQPLPDKGDPVPVPDPRPEASGSTPAKKTPPDSAPDGEIEPPPESAPGREKTGKPATEDDEAGALPKAEQACRASLEDLGARFTQEEPIEDGFCEVDHPITVTALTDSIAIEPPVLLNCQTALTAARFAKNEVSPAARKMLGSRLVGIRQASGYVCRVRAGTETVSEHAYGNALDISAFELADGSDVAVRKYGRPNKDDAAFLSHIRIQACGPFTTVLGPGTNADHATHFHLDLEERHNTATYCH